MKSKIFSWSLLIIFPVIIGLTYNIISPFGIKLFTPIKSNNLNQGLLKSINSLAASKMQSDIDLIYIDSRDPWEYSKSRIAGAINIPEFSFDANSPLVKSLNKTNLYVIYCSSDDCDISFRLGRELQRLKFTNLFIMKDGIDGWIKNRLPAEGCES